MVNWPHSARGVAALPLLFALVVVAGALGAAGCASDQFTPKSDLPSWPAGASPSPAVSISPQADTANVAVGAEAAAGAAGDFYESETDGWEFKPYADIVVTALGYFDDGGDGLRHDHKVGIFDAGSHHAIVIAEIHPDSTLQGAFRWEPIRPVLLLTGKSYVLAGTAFVPYDPEAATAGTWAPELMRGDYRELHCQWGYPDHHFRRPCTGPNFKFKPMWAIMPTP